MDMPENEACSEEMLVSMKYKKDFVLILEPFLFRFHLAMLKCWMEDPEERPTFSQLVVDLSSKLTEMADYLDLNDMDGPEPDSDNESVEKKHQ